jgi:type I thyroxine 5'-deiodinase
MQILRPHIFLFNDVLSYNLFLCVCDSQDSIDISQHKSIKDRLEAAKMLQSLGLPSPLVVDSMANDAMVAYSAIPERLFIVLDGKVVYEGERGPTGYLLGEVKEWLNKWKGN